MDTLIGPTAGNTQVRWIARQIGMALEILQTEVDDRQELHVEEKCDTHRKILMKVLNVAVATTVAL